MPKIFRPISSLLLCLCCIVACSSEDATPPEAADANEAPTWTGVDLVSGQPLNFPQLLDDRPAVMIFWATWCPYCKAFMPYAEGIQADYRAHGVHILALNAKERGRGDPKAYVESLGFPMIAIAEADDIAAQYGVEFIPGLMVVDGKGEVVYRRGWTDLPAGKTVAEQWDAEVRSVLDAIVSASQP